LAGRGCLGSGKQVYGRPVGVAVAKDGSLLVSDDGARVIWRITYNGGQSSLNKDPGLSGVVSIQRKNQ
jgi:hypothetical protein